MFKKPTRKQFIFRRIILSVVALSAITLLVTFAVMSMLGYRFNREAGTFQQGALMQFDSRPNGADVYIDGRLVGGKTANKQAVVAGSHLVEMRKAGYEDWSRSVSVEPGTLTWLNYTRFIPKERKVEVVATYEALSQMLFSPDLKYGIAHESPASPTFQYIDLRSESIKTQELTLPATLFTASEDAEHKFSIVRWNTPSRHVLVRHDFNDKIEWLVVDTHDVGRSINVSRLLSVDFNDIQFAGSNGSSLYGLTSDGVIRKLDLGAGTMTRGFVDSVSSFKMFSTNTLVYSGANPENPERNVVGVYRDGDESSSILRESSKAVPLSIATAQYHGNDYVAISEGAKVTVLKGAYPSAQARSAITSLKQYATFTAPSSVSDLSFSPSGEYLVAQSGEVMTSYEIEYKNLFSGRSASAGIKWLDEAHLWGSAASNLTMADFNSTNSHLIMPATPGYDATLSQNGRFMYAVNKTEAEYSLQRVRMILE